jgi:hypothetical protein
MHLILLKFHQDQEDGCIRKPYCFLLMWNKRVDQYQQTAMEAGIQQQQQREGLVLLSVFIKARRPKISFVFIGLKFYSSPRTLPGLVGISTLPGGDRLLEVRRAYSLPSSL